MEVSSKNPNYSQPLSAVTVLQLPNELLEQIFKYLNSCDFISFVSTCKRFSSFSQSFTHLNLENTGSSLGKSLPLVSSFFQSHLNPSLLRSCNLNGCYWIPAPTLKAFLVRCINLEELHLLETNLPIKYIVSSILPKCSKVTKLSFTLNQGDWLTFYGANLSYRKQPALCRLKSVEMIVADSCTSLEMCHFLQSCEKLEEIVVHWNNQEPINYDSKLSHNPSLLKSVVFVAMYSKYQVFQFFDVSESSNLTSNWCNLMELHNSQNLNNLTSVAWNTPETRNQLLPIDVLHPGLQLGHLESYWEPEPVLMRSVLNSPTKLKLINCFYDSDNFQNFCENHPLLEVLKLGTRWNKTLTVLNEDSWRNISKLRILSLEVALIKQDNERLPFLATIIQSCPLIQELEIIRSTKGFYSAHLTQEELSSIAQLGSTLKRLTLADFNVNNGLFLEHILKACNQLESLRLKSLDDKRGTCCYAANLITALPLAKKLKTFCLFQSNVPQMELLLGVLESCISISRLSLVCPSSSDSFSKNITEEDFTSRMARLCEKMSQLAALFCSFSVPFEHCEEANNLLRERFETERPAFRVDVQSVYRYDDGWDDCICEFYTSKEFPVMFKDLLTSFQSQVALFPYNCSTFLQRNL